MGVCVLGDFTDVTPTSDAVGSLEDLLAWKICDTGIEANDQAYHNSSELELEHISGHRDGCSTACPGDSFYPTLPMVRGAVQTKLDHECNDLFIAPPTSLDGEFNMDDNISLTWEDNADNEDGYQIERSEFINNTFDVIANIPANSTEYIDESFDPGVPYYYKVKATLGDSSSTYSNKFFIEALTNSNSIFNENNVQLFPNPSSGNIKVLINNDFFEKINLSVFDVLGKEIIRSKIFEKNTSLFQEKMDLNDLSSGVYFLKISSGGEIGVFQVIRL